MRPADLLTLIWIYAQLVLELEVVYYLQDSDKIEALREEIDRIEDVLIEWRPSGPVLKEVE